VVHPGHPLVGQTLSVVRRYRERGEQHWVIELADGSRQYVPASWCTPLTPPSESIAMPDHPKEFPQPPLLSLAGLRDLAALVRHLREREGAHGGEHDDGAATEGPPDLSPAEPEGSSRQGEHSREHPAAGVGELRPPRSPTPDPSDRPDRTSAGPEGCEAAGRRNGEVREP